VTDQAGKKTIYTYKDSAASEDVGRLVKAHVQDSTGNLIDELRYTYDKAGNRTGLADQTPSGTSTTSFAYNAANELCWKYAGSSTNACGSPPSGATGYTFNSHGNETAGGSTTYTYDALDRATSLGGTASGYLTPSNGELVSFGTTSFQNNLLGLSRQIAPTATTNYVRDPAGAPSSQRTSSSKQFFLNDALGSTIALTDTSGSIVRSYTYDPDGNATTTGTGATTDLKFAGGHQVGSLYHFGARYYDPAIARWTQQDPITQYNDLTEANRYTYAGDDPANATDPAGMFSLGVNVDIEVGPVHVSGGASVDSHGHVGISGGVGGGGGAGAGVTATYSANGDVEDGGEIEGSGCASPVVVGPAACVSATSKGATGVGVGAGTQASLSYRRTKRIL
jgi:RHS repeat-associated protein